MRAVVGEYDIAVWRSASGVISAWRNRCPHRGMRLSHGFVRGESLACAYHGWHFNCEGFCHYIPAHPELTPPQTVQPAIYSVAEHGGLIWVDPEHDAQPVPLPENNCAVRSLTLNCNASQAVQSLSNIPCSDSTALVSLSESPQVFSTAAADISDGIIIALQQPKPHTVVLHVLANQAVPLQERIVVSRWLEAVRRNAESRNGDAQ